MNPDEQNNFQPNDDANSAMPNPLSQPEDVSSQANSPAPTVIEPMSTHEVVAAAQPVSSEPATTPQAPESAFVSAQSINTVGSSPDGDQAPQMPVPEQQAQPSVMGTRAQPPTPMSPTPSASSAPTGAGPKNTLPLVLIGIGVVLIITILGLVFL